MNYKFEFVISFDEIPPFSHALAEDVKRRIAHAILESLGFKALLITDFVILKID